MITRASSITILSSCDLHHQVEISFNLSLTQAQTPQDYDVYCCIADIATTTSERLPDELPLLHKDIYLLLAILELRNLLRHSFHLSSPPHPLPPPPLLALPRSQQSSSLLMRTWGEGNEGVLFMVIWGVGLWKWGWV
eukprot:738341-Hanusia_phi.AAC.6